MVCICLKLGLNMQEQHHFFFTVNKWKPVRLLDHVPGKKFESKRQVKLSNIHSLHWQLPPSHGDACGHSRRAQSATRPLRRPKITLTAIRQRGQTEQRVQQFSVQLNFSNEGGKFAKNGAIVRGHLQEPDLHLCVWFFEKTLCCGGNGFGSMRAKDGKNNH